MLDTNTVSELARNPQGSVAARIAEVGPDAICVSIITAAELRYGCARAGSPRLLAQIEAILDSLQILALDVPADTEYAGIRAELEAARSEEHTSELQSLMRISYAVSCLKKKTNIKAALLYTHMTY